MLRANIQESVYYALRRGWLAPPADGRVLKVNLIGPRQSVHIDWSWAITKFSKVTRLGSLAHINTHTQSPERLNLTHGVYYAIGRGPPRQIDMCTRTWDEASLARL
jgi:hypothetical protein